MDIFQKTSLGKFISALTEEDKEMLFQRYVTDFIVLSIGVSSVEELQVSGLGTPWVQRRAGRPGPCQCQPGLRSSGPALTQPDSEAAAEQTRLAMAAEIAETLLRKVLS